MDAGKAGLNGNANGELGSLAELVKETRVLRTFFCCWRELGVRGGEREMMGEPEGLLD